MNYIMDGLPQNSDEMKEAPHRWENSPEAAAAGCVAALRIMARDPEEGRKALLALNPDTPQSTLRLAESQLERYPWLPDSYFVGSTPANGYAVPDEPVISLSKNTYSGSEEEGKVKFFLACSGADSPRPVTVIRRDGSWRPGEWSSLIVGIRAPENS